MVEYIRVRIKHAITKSISGTVADSGVVTLPSQPPKGALIVSIVPGTEAPIYIGRLIGSSAISLKLNLTAPSGNLELRSADSGIIPIGTYAEFQLINTNTETLGGSYKQEADIDLMGNAGLSVPDWEPIGTSTAAFTGNFDGDGKNIKRLYINVNDPTDTSIENLGLFGYAGGSFSLSNVHIASGSVTGYYSYISGLLGRANSDTLGTITGCSNSATIAGGSLVGGIVGKAVNVEISNCYNTGTVNAAENVSSTAVGGVVGQLTGSGKIVACYNTGNVTFQYSEMIGGVAGSVTSEMIACYNSGDVTGLTAVGGVLGSDHGGGKITACYNTGNITGTNTAEEFSILSFGGNVKACYWQDGKCSSNNSVGWTGGTADVGKFTTFFTPDTNANTGSAEWGTGLGGSGAYWKVGTTNGNSLPKLWYEK
ncbi:MAG: hypothetical protein Ta2F_13410 [Termitinemataceae bacterium]|nr:MAG: hypothetical protein Ta2F_13410 [Termitinemataceae bacterium]